MPLKRDGPRFGSKCAFNYLDNDAVKLEQYKV